jgi:hypothetical protein
LAFLFLNFLPRKRQSMVNSPAPSVRRFFVFHLHGDNIVECERTVTFLRQALADITTTFEGPFGSPVCPSYKITCQGLSNPIVLTLYPGFGRWNYDILELVRRSGGTLREAADVIITGVADRSETPLLAIEYCGALPAGNQAWQRSGRAYSFGKAQIPYLYVAELGGYELGEDRVRKAARMPNPAVPFSYVSFSMTNETATLPVFVTAPGADQTSRDAYATVFGEADLLTFLRAHILAQSDEAATNALRLKALAFVETKASTSRAGETLTPAQWQQAYEALGSHLSLVDFLVANARLRWTKTAYIDGITTTARSLMDATAAIAIGMTSSKLPMCIVPRDSRPVFADTVERLCEGRIQADFSVWLRRNRHLSICWVMGFKPRGDDARPDRGLPPLARMLIGDDEDLLTVVYGPAPQSTWNHLHNTPRRLSANGLWESIFEASDAMLVDSSTDGIRRHGYLRSHWHEERAQPTGEAVFVQPMPVHIGENDVDTVLHLLLAHHAGSSVFEGMCNPPGGDWSGVSLQSPNRATELRWLTLPRVSDAGAKRPDHVFQLFRSQGLPIILSVESKETAVSVEENIGPRLKNYIQDLLRTPASVERATRDAPWGHSTTTLNINHFVMASAVAFKSDSIDRTANVARRAEADVLMSFTFATDGQSCVVKLIPTTPIGTEIAQMMAAIPLDGISISVVVNAS